MLNKPHKGFKCLIKKKKVLRKVDHVKMMVYEYNSKFSKSCPCDLLIVIANPKRSGNGFLYKVNEKDEFFAVSDVIVGINAVEPIFYSVKITASILHSYKFFIFNLVPLHSPPLKFPKNMT